MSEAYAKNNVEDLAQDNNTILLCIDQPSSPQQNGETEHGERPKTMYETIIEILGYIVRFSYRLLNDVVLTFLCYYYSESSVLPDYMLNLLEAQRQRKYAMLITPSLELSANTPRFIPNYPTAKKKTPGQQSPISVELINTFTANSGSDDESEDDRLLSAETLMVSSNYSIGETIQYKEKVLNFLHFDNEFLVSVYSGNVRRMTEYLKHGASLNQRDFSGRTPLHLAVMAGQARIVKFLLNKGVDPNVEDSVKMTPLANCLFRFPSLKILRLLYEYGAVIPPRSHKTEQRLFSQFVMLCKPTFEEIDCIEFLVSKGEKLEDPDAPGGRQPLHMAAMGNRLFLIKILTDLGANLFELNHRKQTPKEVALAFKCREAYEFLESLEARDLSKERLDLMDSRTEPLMDRASIDTKRSTVRFKTSSISQGSSYLN